MIDVDMSVIQVIDVDMSDKNNFHRSNLLYWKSAILAQWMKENFKLLLSPPTSLRYTS